MEEQQVTVDGESWPLPRPHLVIATQNPLSQRGTYSLVESQLDRFALSTAIGYPDASDEMQLVLQHGGSNALDDLEPVCSSQEWLETQRTISLVEVSPAVATYAVDLCRATRSAPEVRLGASPRAAIWLVRCAQANALLSGRNYLLPDDVKAIAVACLAHRLVSDDGYSDNVASGKLVQAVVESVPSPRP
jgi:MoxR-like ATPase